ncbi:MULTISPECIES: hypothetical protein [unclassified Sulfitobacter]|uniref:hypothetical protein n=1 Tax=unclassified Sulfitobacter TaxID=196795 RepID=UPI003744E296
MSSSKSTSPQNTTQPLTFETDAEKLTSACNLDQVNCSANPFQVETVNYIGGPSFEPHIVPHEKAQVGDIIGVYFSVTASVDQFPSHDYGDPVFYVQGDNEIKAVFSEDLPKEKKAAAARIISDFYLSQGHDKTAHRRSMFPCPESYQYYVVYFSHAILMTEATWLHGDILDVYEEWELDQVNPVLIAMQEVKDNAASLACVEKTRTYLKLFKQLLPENVRELADWNIRMPDPADFLSSWANRK